MSSRYTEVSRGFVPSRGLVLTHGVVPTRGIVLTRGIVPEHVMVVEGGIGSMCWTAERKEMFESPRCRIRR